MTLVLKGDAAYFDTPDLNNSGVSLEREDCMTIHLMEANGAAVDGRGIEGKQAAVKALLVEAPDDNIDAFDGLDVDGYALRVNGAVYFTPSPSRSERSASTSRAFPTPPGYLPVQPPTGGRR
eukprot:2400862-Rhodomonas_salina.2